MYPEDINLVFIIPLIFIVALLYSVVGHGGASGYIAVLTFFHYESGFISTSALILNLVVSLIAFSNFKKMGYFDYKLLLPFIITSVLFAFVGGYIKVSKTVFSLLLGISLLFSAGRLLFAFTENGAYKNKVPLFLGLTLGSVIGFVSGIVGIGGGIFLSPILIFLKFANPKSTAAVSSIFIFINSISGLLAKMIRFKLSLPSPNLLIIFLIVVVLGGYIGSYLSSKKFSISVLQKVLGITLIIAGLKLIFTSVQQVV